MNLKYKQLNKLVLVAIFLTFTIFFHNHSNATQDASQKTHKTAGADLDLSIKYYNRDLRPDGVLHESSYEETMLRRSGHVWTQRVLPPVKDGNASAHATHEHKDFDYIVLPRHVSFDGNKISIAFVNAHEQEVVNIVPTEYENVNFDGSWNNTYYLVNPQVIAAMPSTSRKSTVANTRWHERTSNGLFQRVLWDEKRLIPLVIETGSLTGKFLQRITVTPSTSLIQDLPWNHQQGYAQKEYSDFLD